MVVALLLVAELYAVLFAALYGCYLLWPAGWPYWLVAAVALAASVVVHYHGAERLLLGVVRAKIVSRVDEPGHVPAPGAPRAPRRPADAEGSRSSTPMSPTPSPSG